MILLVIFSLKYAPIFALIMRWLFLHRFWQKTGSLQDVFYTDLRDPSAIDLTRPILDWLRNSKEEAQKKWEYIINGELQQKQKAIMGEASVSHLPHFTSVEMHKIRFCDLSFRLGAGYLYCHQVLSFYCLGFIGWLLPSFYFSFIFQFCF